MLRLVYIALFCALLCACAASPQEVSCLEEEAMHCDVSAYCYTFIGDDGNRFLDPVCQCQEGFLGDGWVKQGEPIVPLSGNYSGEPYTGCQTEGWTARVVLELPEPLENMTLCSKGRKVCQFALERSTIADKFFGMPVNGHWSMGSMHHSVTVTSGRSYLTINALWPVTRHAELSARVFAENFPISRDGTPFPWGITNVAENGAPRVYRWKTETTSAALKIQPTGMQVDAVHFAADCGSQSSPSGCWVIDVTYTTGARTGNFNTFFVPKAVASDKLSYDPVYTDDELATFQARNFPCGSNVEVDDEVAGSQYSTCCLPKFVSNYRPIQSFVNWTETFTACNNSVGAIVQRPNFDEYAYDVAFPHDMLVGQFEGMPDSPGVVFMGVVDAYIDQYQARFYLDEVELRTKGGQLRGTAGVEYTIDTFVGIANFRPTGTESVDPAAHQVNIHLEKTNFFSVSTQGVNAYTFLEYVNLRLVAVYNDDAGWTDLPSPPGSAAAFINASGAAHYVQVTFTMGSQYRPNLPAGLIPLESVIASKGTFFDAPETAATRRPKCLDYNQGNIDFPFRRSDPSDWEQAPQVVDTEDAEAAGGGGATRRLLEVEEEGGTFRRHHGHVDGANETTMADAVVGPIDTCHEQSHCFTYTWEKVFDHGCEFGDACAWKVCQIYNPSADPFCKHMAPAKFDHWCKFNGTACPGEANETRGNPEWFADTPGMPGEAEVGKDENCQVGRPGEYVFFVVGDSDYCGHFAAEPYQLSAVQKQLIKEDARGSEFPVGAEAYCQSRSTIVKGCEGCGFHTDDIWDRSRRRSLGGERRGGSHRDRRGGYNHADVADNCHEQSDCLQWTIELVYGDDDDACEDGDCEYEVCMILDRNTECLMSSTSRADYRYTCPKDALECHNNSDFSGTSQDSAHFFQGGEAHKQCQRGVGGATLNFLLNDGGQDQCGGTYLWEENPEDPADGAVIQCRPRPRWMESCHDGDWGGSSSSSSGHSSRGSSSDSGSNSRRRSGRGSSSSGSEDSSSGDSSSDSDSGCDGHDSSGSSSSSGSGSQSDRGGSGSDSRRRRYGGSSSSDSKSDSGSSSAESSGCDGSGTHRPAECAWSVTLPACKEPVFNGIDTCSRDADVIGHPESECVWSIKIPEECQPDPTCTDGIKNQNETGIDCGGECGECDCGSFNNETSGEYFCGEALAATLELSGCVPCTCQDHSVQAEDHERVCGEWKNCHPCLCDAAENQCGELGSLCEEECSCLDHHPGGSGEMCGDFGDGGDACEPCSCVDDLGTCGHWGACEDNVTECSCSEHGGVHGRCGEFDPTHDTLGCRPCTCADHAENKCGEFPNCWECTCPGYTVAPNSTVALNATCGVFDLSLPDFGCRPCDCDLDGNSSRRCGAWPECERCSCEHDVALCSCKYNGPVGPPARQCGEYGIDGASCEECNCSQHDPDTFDGLSPGGPPQCASPEWPMCSECVCECGGVYPLCDECTCQDHGDGEATCGEWPSCRTCTCDQDNEDGEECTSTGWPACEVCECARHGTGPAVCGTYPACEECTCEQHGTAGEECGAWGSCEPCTCAEHGGGQQCGSFVSDLATDCEVCDCTEHDPATFQALAARNDSLCGIFPVCAPCACPEAQCGSYPDCRECTCEERPDQRKCEPVRPQCVDTGVGAPPFGAPPTIGGMGGGGGLPEDCCLPFDCILEQQCAPDAEMCVSPVDTPDHFVSFNIPLGIDWLPETSEHLTASVFVEFVVNAIDVEQAALEGREPNDGDDAEQMKTTLFAAIPVVEAGINIFCAATITKTDLKDVANADIIVGSAATADELTRLRILKDLAASTLREVEASRIDSDSIEAGLLTLVLRGNNSYFATSNRHSLVLEDLISVHVMEPSTCSDCVFDYVQGLIAADADGTEAIANGNNDGYAINGAFRFEVDVSEFRANMHPSEALLERCPYNPVRPSQDNAFPTSCITRRDVFRNGFPRRVGGLSTAMELAALDDAGECQEDANQVLFMQSIMGASQYAAQLAADFACVVARQYKLNGRTNRAFWINPGYEWTPSQTGGQPLFTVSQKIFVFALIRLDEGMSAVGPGVPSPSGPGPFLSRRRLLQTSGDVSGTGTGLAGTVQEFDVTQRGIMAGAYGVPVEHVATFRASLQLSDDEACLPHEVGSSSLVAAVRPRLAELVDAHSTRLETVQILWMTVHRGSVDCSVARRRRVGSRRLLASGATADLEMMVVFALGEEAPGINLASLGAAGGIEGLEEVEVAQSVDTSGAVVASSSSLLSASDEDPEADASEGGGMGMVLIACAGVGGLLCVIGTVLAHRHCRGRDAEYQVEGANGEVLFAKADLWSAGPAASGSPKHLLEMQAKQGSDDVNEFDNRRISAESLCAIERGGSDGSSPKSAQEPPDFFL